MYVVVLQRMCLQTRHIGYYLEADISNITWRQTYQILPGDRHIEYYLETELEYYMYLEADISNITCTWRQTYRIFPEGRHIDYYLEADVCFSFICAVG